MKKPAEVEEKHQKQSIQSRKKQKVPKKGEDKEIWVFPTKSYEELKSEMEKTFAPSKEVEDVVKEEGTEKSF